MNIFLPLALTVILAGCATNNGGNGGSEVGGTTPKQAVESALPYIAPAVTLACKEEHSLQPALG